MIVLAVKLGFPAASCSWIVMSHVEVELAIVVGVLVQALAVVASFAAGPAATTVKVFEADVSPVDVAVSVQEPGTPVIVNGTLAVVEAAPRVVVVELVPAVVVT